MVIMKKRKEKEKEKKNCGHVKGDEHDTETAKCSQLNVGKVTRYFPSKLQIKQL